MNKPRRNLLLPLVHCAVLAAGSLVLAQTAGRAMHRLPATVLDPRTELRSIQAYFTPAGSAVSIGSHGTLTLSLDNQGQVVQKISTVVSFPSANLVIGSVSSPNLSCQRTIQLLRQDGEVLMSCTLEKPEHQAQLMDIFSIAYVPIKAGSASIRVLPDQSSASGPSGTLRLDTREASLTIAP